MQAFDVRMSLQWTDILMATFILNTATVLFISLLIRDARRRRVSYYANIAIAGIFISMFD